MAISRKEALDCFRSDDLIGLAMEAVGCRRRLHPENVVTYSLVHEPLLREVGNDAAWTHSEPSLAPSTAVRVRCCSADDSFVAACSNLRRRMPDAWLEIQVSPAATWSPSLSEQIARWAASGVNSVLLDARTQVGDYAAISQLALDLYRAAHRAGLLTPTVAVPFGSGESFAQRLDFLDAAADFQQETGALRCLAPVAVAAPGARQLDEATAVERLKIFAIARMYVNDIPHLQAVQVGDGLKVLQSELQFGADDAQLVLSPGHTTRQDLRRVIRDAGFTPVERDGAFDTLFLD